MNFNSDVVETNDLKLFLVKTVSFKSFLQLPTYVSKVDLKKLTHHIRTCIHTGTKKMGHRPLYEYNKIYKKSIDYKP